MRPSDTYCVLPFIHLEINDSGLTRPCCLSSKHLFEGEHKFQVEEDSLRRVWHSDEMNELRAALLSGKKHHNCDRCWNDERVGISSKRQRDNAQWKKLIRTTPSSLPLTFDLKLGNLCNLKCRICNPNSSSKFAAEAAQIFGDIDLEAMKAQRHWVEQDDSLFWQGMDEALENIEHFDIYGGEPFLSKQHFNLLERSVERGYSRKQTIHYNTNGTIFPEKAAEKIWPYFKNVNVMFSLDGEGARFEYQRYPASWNQVTANVARFQRHRYLDLNVCFTVNVMNIWNLPALFRWGQLQRLPVWVNYLYDLEIFRVQIFSDAAKSRIEQHLRRQRLGREYTKLVEPLIAFMWDRRYTAQDRRDLQWHLQTYDKARDQRFAQVFPEIAELLTLEDYAAAPAGATMGAIPLR